MMGLGLPELAIILLIVVVIFGARKLPELGRGLGSGMREFKAGVTGQDDKPSAIDQPAEPSAPVQPPAATPVATPAGAEPVAPSAAEPVVPPAPAPAPAAEPQQPPRTEE